MSRFLSFAAAAIFAILAVAAPARAADYCDRYPDALTPADIRAYQIALRRIAPLKHIELAYRFEIVNAPRDGNLGPVVTQLPGDRYQVAIPSGFKPMLCRLALLYFQLGPRVGPVVEAAKGDLNACIEAKRYPDPTDCLYRLVQDVTSDATARGNIVNQDPETMRVMIDGAMVFALLHEFAHVAQDHFGGGGGDPETRADLYAVIRSTIFDAGNTGFLGAMVSQIMLGMLDDSVDPDDPHGRFTCRAESMKTVAFAVDPQIRSIMWWPEMSGQEYLTRQRTPAYLAEQQKLFPPRLTDAELRRAGCRPADTRYIASVRRDLDTIAATLDRIAAAEVPGATSPFAFYDVLAGLRLATLEGRSVRARLIGLRLWRISERMSKGGSGIAVATYLSYVERELARPGSEEIASQDYGAMLSMRGLSIVESVPDRDFADSRMDLAAADFRRAVYYRPGDSPAYMGLAMIMLMRDQCSAAFAWLNEGAETVDDEGGKWAMTAMRDGLAQALADGGCHGVGPKVVRYLKQH